MIALLAAGLLSPFYLDVTPEVRTTYVSLGKIFEDRPMQTTFIRGGWDSGTLDARDTNARSSSPYTHNDWTHGGVGIRFRF